jgi:hypothetical protein
MNGVASILVSFYLPELMDGEQLQSWLLAAWVMEIKKKVSPDPKIALPNPTDSNCG